MRDEAGGVEGALDPLLGRTLNSKYRIQETIGAGSMGTVYLAEHIGLNKSVALKVLRTDLEVDGELLQRFSARALRRGASTTPTRSRSSTSTRWTRFFYLAMEYVDGVTLTDFIKRTGPAELEIATELVRQILEALAAAHEQGIVHRDLKPDNVMVIEHEDGGLTIKVLDFGLSKLVHQPLGASVMTQPGRIMGTPRYMAPEQGTGDEVDHRSDLYAVGLLFYELLAADYPFQADTMRELLVKQATEPPPSLLGVHPEVDEDVDEFLFTSLAKSKEERFDSATEMLQALDAWDEEAEDHAPAPRRRSAAPRHRNARARRQRKARAERETSRSWLPWAAGVGLLLLAGGAWSLWGGGGGASAPRRVSEKAAEDRTQEEARYVGILTTARGLLAGGDASDSLRKIQEARDSPVRDSEFFFLRGEIYRADQDGDTALADYDQGPRARPRVRRCGLWSGLGRAGSRRPRARQEPLREGGGPGRGAGGGPGRPGAVEFLDAQHAGGSDAASCARAGSRLLRCALLPRATAEGPRRPGRGGRGADPGQATLADRLAPARDAGRGLPHPGSSGRGAGPVPHGAGSLPGVLGRGRGARQPAGRRGAPRGSAQAPRRPRSAARGRAHRHRPASHHRERQRGDAPRGARSRARRTRRQR